MNNMDYRTLLKTKKEIIKVSGEVYKEDYDIIRDSDIDEKKILMEAYKEIAEQVRRQNAIQSITPKNPITEKVIKPIRGEYNNENDYRGDVSKRLYNTIRAHPLGVTFQQLIDDGFKKTSIYNMVTTLIKKGFVIRKSINGILRVFAKDINKEYGSKQQNNEQEELSEMFPKGTKTEVFK